MNENLREILWLLSIAMLVAMVARRLRLPYTVGLVAVGALLAALRIDVGPDLTSELILDLILPPLLFEAALALRWRDLVADRAAIALYALLGTLVAMVVVTLGLVYLFHFPLAPSLVFGALISATDPVAIIAMFKDNHFEGRLSVLVEAESLFNDGVAAVLFALAAGFAAHQGQGLSGADIAVELARVALGGLAIGALAGASACLLARGVTDHLIELTLSTIAAFASFLAAEHLGASGVLATVTAGLIVGHFGLGEAERPSVFTPRGRESLGRFWEFAAFLANSVIFLLIGANIALAPYENYHYAVIIGVVALTLVARACAVYPLSLLLRGGVSLAEQHVLWWGGLRGALGLALALSLPASLPLREEIIVVTFAAVAFSILAQGLSMPLLLRRLNLLR